MHFQAGQIYHVYNRGNNKTKIFFNAGNYLYLLRKVRTEWLIYCDIICYCLMPNHFHFMLQPNEEGCITIVLKNQPSHLQVLSKTIGKTLSSYTQAINIQNNTTGNLFQKKTKAKCLTDSSLTSYSAGDYLLNCFLYIHNNPLPASLVRQLEDWPYSSWADYYNSRHDSLCNKDLTAQKIGLSNLDINPSREIIDDKIIDGIW